MRIVVSLAFAAICAAAPARALEQGDAAHGKTLYAQCRACHMPQANSIGPKHCGVVGRKAASVADYDYSPAMRGSGLTWTPENLDRFLESPAKAVPGNFMPFAGLHKQKDRDDIVAYLATLVCR
jgi:cytochrome c2